jgi:hypothetical protein
MIVHQNLKLQHYHHFSHSSVGGHRLNQQIPIGDVLDALAVAAAVGLLAMIAFCCRYYCLYC